MAQTHKAPRQAAKKHATSNGSDVSRDETEELAALRAIVDAASRSSGEENMGMSSHPPASAQDGPEQALTDDDIPF